MKIFCEYEHEFDVLLSVAKYDLDLDMPDDFTVNPSEQSIVFNGNHGEDVMHVFNNEGVYVDGYEYKIVNTGNGKMFVTSEEE